MASAPGARCPVSTGSCALQHEENGMVHEPLETTADPPDLANGGPLRREPARPLLGAREAEGAVHAPAVPPSVHERVQLREPPELAPAPVRRLRHDEPAARHPQ